MEKNWRMFLFNMIKIFSYALTVFPLISLIFVGILVMISCYDNPWMVFVLIGISLCGLFYIIYFECIQNDIIDFLNFITNNENKTENNIW